MTKNVEKEKNSNVLQSISLLYQSYNFGFIILFPENKINFAFNVIFQVSTLILQIENWYKLKNQKFWKTVFF